MSPKSAKAQTWARRQPKRWWLKQGEHPGRMVECPHDRQPIEADLPVNPDHFPVAERQVDHGAEIAQAGEAQTEDNDDEARLDE